MGIRRAGRENALKALYVLDICKMKVEEVIPIFAGAGGLPEEAAIFSESLIRGTTENRQEIDSLISKYSQNWSIERMPSIDRNIIRLAAFELIKNVETPINVIINEAVEIAKIYSTVESSKFVNGILDKIKDSRKAK